MPYRPFSISIFAFALIFFVLLLAIPANADNLYASIRGTVTDPTGAVMQGVKLMATNTATGITTSTTSNKDGIFVFLQLAIGDYTVKAEQTGFKKFQASGIHLDLNQVYNFEVKLAVGAISEELIVEANPVQVQQADMQLGTTMQAQQIVDIPLNGRNWAELQQLQPGIVGTTDRFGDNQGYSGNGAQTQQNSFLINGLDSNDTALNTALVIPSPDAIGEFRLVSSTLNPEYGRNSGTIINAAIKNGTNQFHGDAFEFYRDTFLDAKNYFETQPSPFHQNQYGGTIGGPIYKDHAFFFFSYQGLHQRVPQTGGNTPVYSSAERGGDFGDFAANFNGVLDCPGAPIPCSVVSTPNASPQPLVGDANSPCPGTVCPAGTPFGIVYSSTGCTTTTCPIITNGLFSTGKISPDGTINLDPLALKLMNQFVPLPTNPSVNNNFLFNPITTASDNQYIYRVDDKLTSRDALWFYGLYETNPTQDTLPFTGSTLPGMAEQAKQHQQQYSVAWTHTFSPTTLNEARLGYTRFNFVAVEPVSPINPTSYGFSGITPQNASLASLPVMNVTGLFTLGFSANGPQPRIQNVYQAIDNFSKVWGHHTFKAGVNFDRLSINNPFYNNLGGNFSYNGGGAFSTKVPGADFLLGFPDSYAQGSGSIVQAFAHELYLYVQDQWQIRPNLTLTYGTGWDVETPWLNKFGGGEIMGAFRPGQQSTIFPTAPVGFVWPGDTGINKYGGMTIKYNHFAPRVGFAWQPRGSHNWSVHGGFGIYYNRSEEELALQTLTNAPFAVTSTGATSTCGSPAFATPFVGVAGGCSATNPFPFTPPAKGAPVDFSVYYPIGFGFNTEDPRFTAPRSANFNLTVERQIDRATVVTLAYVGNRGRHQEGAIDLNLAGTAPGVNPVAAAFNGGSCFTGLILTSPNCPQTPLGAAQVPGATPFNLGVYGHIGEQTTEFNSRYDSLQATFNRRFSHGLQVLAAYTWSRYFDQTSSLESNAFNFPGINPFDPRHMWAPSANDAPQRFVVSYTYTLPFYSLTHAWKRLTDDWNLTGIYTLQHGTPVGVFDLLATSLTCDLFAAFYACPDRADRTSAPLGIRDPRNKNGNNPSNLYFNPAAFAVPAAGSGVGTASRNPLYGPGINYGDMALEKKIRIDEARYFELRLETYNTFNHTNFANPATPGFNTEDVSPITGALGSVFSTRRISTQGEGRAVQLGLKFYF